MQDYLTRLAQGYANHAGQRYGNWTAVSLSRRHKTITYWNCICVCGERREIGLPVLLKGRKCFNCYAIKRKASMIKVCSKCKRCLGKSNFDIDAKRLDGHYPQCRECRVEKKKAQREWFRNLRPEDLPSHKKCTKCKRSRPIKFFGLLVNSTDGFACICKGCMMIAYRVRKYGISKHDLKLMLQKQDNRCAVYRNKFGKTRLSRMAVNHDHVTEKVRELLCWGCNFGIGYFRDSPALFRSALKYLEKHK